eukprot:CAMPEP_0195519242 /NCGR_PEP_ID=MMETSP0794_2-20130614/14533_1 /TAXON_ID=515487 /ORGANISM="Stephanopyxis turris, Strain CCMP 815" /LENGTH=340 /DNA_ID=CAMNT_0040648365 /DNA_START=45 /DNA_END=1067 /DNA_ORIENTATION=+
MNELVDEKVMGTTALASMGSIAETVGGRAGFKLVERSKPYEVSVRALKGDRLYMEDEYFISDGGRFAAVFDGHGGSGVSTYLREKLYKRMRYYLSAEEEHEVDITGMKNASGASNPLLSTSIAARVAALRSAFREIDREVMAKDGLQYQGSTAVAVVVHEGEDGNRTLLSANIGDSRAVLSRRRQAIDLTRDHKPNDEKEKARILALGEKIEWDGYAGLYRVRNLSLSRAIGDRFAKPAISGEVEIKRFPVADDGADEFCVLASDGLWDVFESQEAVDFVHRKMNAGIPEGENRKLTLALRRKHMSRFLAQQALKRGSGDNICVVVVWLDKSDKGLTHQT